VIGVFNDIGLGWAFYGLILGERMMILEKWTLLDGTLDEKCGCNRPAS
jgi:hypothetical protein